MKIDFLNQKEGFEKINALGQKREPFLFIISYDKKKIYAKEIKSLDKDIKYSLEHYYNSCNKKTDLKKFPISFDEYKKNFNKVIEEIKRGNTYLLNLTFKTKIKTNLTLEEIYNKANAPYKLLIKDGFVCFSPEKFIEIKNNIIATYPMKGTIDAAFKNAKEKILNNKKELAEHTMVVDLLRNDLNIVATNTKVEKFRFITKIKAGKKELLQVSSKITAQLNRNWEDNIGNILNKLTPAGSITGTPKKKTIEIINNIEKESRGLYTGIFGIYDGVNLNSAVMIRTISKVNNILFYQSGGGITLDSDLKTEYLEMIDKIYLPL